MGKLPENEIRKYAKGTALAEAPFPCEHKT